MTITEQDLVRHLSEAAVSIELQTPEMTLNIGPQHPSTHGVLRLVAQVDGERTHNLQPVIGYMHRGYEKLTEVRNYAQITTLINRIDWVSGYANEVPFIVAAEKLMQLEVPERAQYIRLILTEMARISSHLIFMASYPLELGAATPLFFALRDRERVLDLLESVTGGRFHPNFNRIGGVKPNAGAGSTQRKVIQDLPKSFLGETRAAMDKVLESADEIEDLVAGNEIILARTKGIGMIPADVAASFGFSGPNLRASGVGFDLRKVSDYLPYSKFKFNVPVGAERRLLGSLVHAPARDPGVGRASFSRPSTAFPPVRSRRRCPRSSRCPRARSTCGQRIPRARWGTTSFPMEGSVPTG